MHCDMAHGTWHVKSSPLVMNKVSVIYVTEPVVPIKCNEKKTTEFLRIVDRVLSEAKNKRGIASWNFAVDVTDANKKKVESCSARFSTVVAVTAFSQ